MEELCDSVRDHDEETIEYKLTFIKALYFSMTVVTTIGQFNDSLNCPIFIFI